jgi:hypothetical protein
MHADESVIRFSSQIKIGFGANRAVNLNESCVSSRLELTKQLFGSVWLQAIGLRNISCAYMQRASLNIQTRSQYYDNDKKYAHQ